MCLNTLLCFHLTFGPSWQSQGCSSTCCSPLLKRTYSPQHIIMVVPRFNTFITFTFTWMCLKARKTRHSWSWSSGRGCSCWCASLPWSTACTTPWSKILLRFLIFLYIQCSEYLVWHRRGDSQNQRLFRPMGAQITSIVFPPMRWELTKLNRSSYPQSRILSPFQRGGEV